MAKLEYTWSYISKSLDNFKAALLGYRTYKAFIKQVENQSPTVDVLENSLGIQITYEYVSTGYCIGTINKPLFNDATTGIYGENAEVTITPSSGFNGNIPATMGAQPIFFNVIQLTTYSNGGPSDGFIGVTFSSVLEIKIYNK